MGWNYLFIPKLQRCNRWSLGMDKPFHPTLYQAYSYLSVLELKLNHVCKRGPLIQKIQEIKSSNTIQIFCVSCWSTTLNMIICSYAINCIQSLKYEISCRTVLSNISRSAAQSLARNITNSRINTEEINGFHVSIICLGALKIHYPSCGK